MSELELPPYQLALEALRPNERRGNESGYDRIDPKPEAAELAQAMSGLGYRLGHAAVTDVVEVVAEEKEYWGVFQPHLTSEELAALPEGERGLPRWNGRSWQIPCDANTYSLGVVHDYFRLPRGWHSVKNYRLALADRYRKLGKKITDQSQGALWLPSWLYFSDRSLEAKKVPRAFQRDSLEAAIEQGADIELEGNAYYRIADGAISAALPGNRPEHELRKLRHRKPRGPEQVETVKVHASELIAYVLEHASDPRSLWFEEGVGREAEELARAAVRMKYRPSQEDAQRMVDHGTWIWELLQLHEKQRAGIPDSEKLAIGA